MSPNVDGYSEFWLTGDYVLFRPQSCTGDDISNFYVYDTVEQRLCGPEDEDQRRAILEQMLRTNVPIVNSLPNNGGSIFEQVLSALLARFVSKDRNTVMENIRRMTRSGMPKREVADRVNSIRAAIENGASFEEVMTKFPPS